MRPERAERVLRLAQVAAIFAIIVTPFIAFALAGLLYTPWSFSWWAGYILFILLGAPVIKYAAAVIVILLVYKSDYAAAATELLENEQEPQKTLEITTMRIHATPDLPIGKYKDAQIWEWMDFELPHGTIVRGVFAGTFDIDKGEVTMPEDTLLIAPGILYEFKDLKEARLY